MTAVDKMLNVLREVTREACDDKEYAEVYYGVLNTAFGALGGHVDPKTVTTRLRAQIEAAQRALDIIHRAGESE